MEDLESLLKRTLAGDLDAFAEVVARFQDMALGYAYSVLGDFHDAQDAAQEAFIAAYAHLGELREPRRFPGWFRRIVLSACRKLARARPSPTVPLEQAQAAAPAASDPARLAERHEMKDAVLAAIRSLTPPNRAAAVLFYVNGYSVDEIARFLDVPAGTVKRRLHDSRKKLKASMAMVRERLGEERPSPEFREEILKRIAHWERFKGSEDEKLEMVASDPEWVRLLELELDLEPMSPECRAIRKRIACMEACHEHYVGNVTAVLQMIGAMKPSQVLDCGQACAERRAEADAYARALETWGDADALPDDADEPTREVFELLGKPTDAKRALVEHLIGKLRDNAYQVYADEDEDFELTESRIQHLEICNYNWRNNLRIVLREIAAGKRLFAWHTPDGYNAHGDVPDRIPQLRELVAPVVAWIEGRADPAGRWGEVLGQPTPEKRWLVASLCKHITDQHKEHPTARFLPDPALQ